MRSPANYFASAFVNAPLTAPATGTTPNGVFRYGRRVAFPTGSVQRGELLGRPDLRYCVGFDAPDDHVWRVGEQGLWRCAGDGVGDGWRFGEPGDVHGDVAGGCVYVGWCEWLDDHDRGGGYLHGAGEPGWGRDVCAGGSGVAELHGREGAVDGDGGCEVEGGGECEPGVDGDVEWVCVGSDVGDVGGEWCGVVFDDGDGGFSGGFVSDHVCGGVVGGGELLVWSLCCGDVDGDGCVGVSVQFVECGGDAGGDELG